MPRSRAMQPSVPGFGGTTVTGPFFPLTTAWIENEPPPERSMLTVFTGPCSPRESLYVKPVLAEPDQKGLPLLLVPCASTNVCALGVAPLASTWRMAPPAMPARVGSPTRRLGLFFSLAGPAGVRFDGSAPGFGSLTVRELPRIACAGASVVLVVVLLVVVVVVVPPVLSPVANKMTGTQRGSRPRGRIVERLPENARPCGATVPSRLAVPWTSKGSIGCVHVTDSSRGKNPVTGRMGPGPKGG